jgi:MraZ protein
VFRGTFQHAVDAKGRTSLPSKFRELVSATGSSNVIVTKGPDNALWCYAPKEFEAIEARLRAKSPFDSKVRAFTHQFVAPAQECEFDKMGRILVPVLLRKYAALEGEAVFVGNNEHIEIWSVEAWKRREEATQGAFAMDPFGSEGM